MNAQILRSLIALQSVARPDQERAVTEPVTEAPPAGDSQPAHEKTITVTVNGPYEVNGSVPIRDSAGHPIEAEETYWMCRCGGSKSKPFCDGTHKKNGFMGEEVANRGPIASRRVAFRGNGVTIYDDRSICAHIGNCTDNLTAVFKLNTEPWVDPVGAEAGEIVSVVRTCPSGAVSYALGESEDPVEEERPAAITASKDGPYFVTGNISLQSEDGTGYEDRVRYTLCRCGGSKNKPFCDGTHWHIGFKAGP